MAMAGIWLKSSDGKRGGNKEERRCVHISVPQEEKGLHRKKDCEGGMGRKPDPQKPHSRRS